MPKSPPQSSPPISQMTTVPFGSLSPSRLNPRSSFPARGIRNLADTIAEDGLLEPLLVRPSAGEDGRFEIAAGERRYRALERLHGQGRISADWPVPVQVRELSDRELLTLALVENLLREDLHPLDEGQAFKDLVEAGVRTAEIARRVKRSQRHIQLRIQLTGLDPQVQKAFRAGEIHLAQARVLATAPPDRHVPAFNQLRKYPSVFDDPKNLMSLLAQDSFPQSRAEFSPNQYGGPTLKDPDTGQVYYLDLAKVLELQMKAAEGLRDKLRDERDLKEVEILQGGPAQVWTRYRESQRPTHGVILIGSDGEISVFDQLAPLEEAADAGVDEDAAAKTFWEASAPEDAGSGTPVPAMLAAAAQRIRNTALQEALFESPDEALRLAVVGLLQAPDAPESGIAFRPTRPAPSVDPEAGLEGRLQARLEELLGSDAVHQVGLLAGEASSPEASRLLFEALAEVPREQLLDLLAVLVSTRVGSPALRSEDTPLVAHLGHKLGVQPATPRWLHAGYLQHYSRARLIRLALDSGAVAPAEAESLADLTRPQIIDRILDSPTRDPEYIPPELRFERR